MRLRSGVFALSVSLATILSAVPGLMHPALADDTVTVPDAPVVIRQQDIPPPATANAQPAKIEMPSVSVPDAPVVIRTQDLPAQAAQPEAPLPVAIDTPFAAPKAAGIVVAAPTPPAAKPNLDPAVERPNVDTTPTASIPQPTPPKSEPAKTADAPTLSNEALKDAAQTYAQAELPHGRASEAALRKTRDEILAFYAARDDAPLWIENGAWSPAAQSAVDQLAHAGDDGLNVDGYPIPSLRGASAADLAQAELRLSEAIVAYGQQAGGSRIDPIKLSPLLSAKPQVARVDEILTQVSAAANAGDALQNFNPPQPGYRALRDKLAELRHEQAGKDGGDRATIRIPLGPVLKIGMQDTRVPLIRTRLGLDGTPAAQKPEDLLYDTRVADAVADFQRSSGLPASGTLTPRTISALSGGEPHKLEAELLANMERWRWVPRDMGEEHIEVNIPDFTVRVIEDGQVIHRARAIVGKPDRQTPIFSNTMQFLIVNPSWNVPQSIIKKEMLPKLAEDPDYLTKHGYEVTQHGNTISVRQPPGERNALGHIKFMFPNDYSVYLHDTPTRNLFANDYRAYSHGCVRVDQPMSLAGIVLGPQSGWTEQRIKGLIGRGERTIPLPKPLPIHIMYFTTYVDENGKLIVRDDIYGHDRKVEAALGLQG
ncbi:L,D-transpeptidase family protein [Methylovirgula sp. 4M-Z18]|uniref:L,D-transpeptidase family protein n=1 Tax=Methylovirgula sp. 4M-Z18 TaxID=2293567 RepID=UPI0013142DAD|nr:L,D-transpeptidase family protein [Methylovirgula sp. 4M-Z18]